ncbi:MAG: hypothetical protein LQ349_007481 [Xanthoria aureola]|nr:MAG: hypothetical protein LQ349_007481 [Xanthoria aureola]
MRPIQTIIILLTLLCFLIDAATIPEEHRKRSSHDPNGKTLEPRGKPRRQRKPGHRRKKKDEGMPKYFHEPGGTQLGNHYDSRYHHGIQDYADRKDTQLHLLRAYLTFFHVNHIETWLAHGTLLGWWWNGKMLPWDWDIDTQVSGSTLKYLGDRWNGTHYDYVSPDDPPVKRTYLLDVNPASIERERGNGNNIIDARWIDTSNGLYIDITGLSETHPDDQPGVWACKNYHRYHTTDLYPMRETMYEGVIAKVPYAYDRILTQEYNERALVLTDYQGHRWDPVVKEWLPKSEEELEEDRKEKEAADKIKEAQKKREEARKEEANKKQEAEKEKKLREQERKDKEKAEKEKERADKKAEVQRLKAQQFLMREKSQKTKEVEQPKTSDEGSNHKNVDAQHKAKAGKQWNGEARV